MKVELQSNKEWQTWGRVDPLWSVASWPGKERSGATPWTPEEFLALGAADFGDILKHWRHFGLVPERCVEIGCGAGRITAQLASVFERVDAIDVSADQLRLAQQLLGSSAAKVQFHHVKDATIPLPDQSCTGMFSCHVFQHFSQFDGVARYLEETIRVLASGGTACFHIPVPGAHRGAAVSKLRLTLHNVSVKVRRFVGGGRIMEYHRYSPTAIFNVLKAIGFRNAELRVFDMSSNGDAHSFFFVRRP